LCCFFLACSVVYRALHSFPTRRSSDLAWGRGFLPLGMYGGKRLLSNPFDHTHSPFPVTLSLRFGSPGRFHLRLRRRRFHRLLPADRKSTRLNSSHVSISYAVFCLKKKN